jgi:prepilin-type N-terminal cleavage/methylation domain-containing protein
MRTDGRFPRLLVLDGDARGFTLVELLVVVLLLAIAMLGILAVFDASARINKSEQDVADAQGAVRYGIYQMTRAIRMAGSGGLFLTQAVLNRPDPALPGITVGSARGYDNVTGATVTDLASVAHPVRENTDMIEVRGVLLSPLLSFDLSTGCGTCTGSTNVNTAQVTGQTLIGTHFNDDPTYRPQFAAIDAYTAGVSAAQPMFVIVSGNDDLHGGCSTPFGPQGYPQPSYNVGRITLPTSLVSSSTFGAVNFADAQAVEFNTEDPADPGTSPVPLPSIRRGGILDDIVYFIDNTDPNHPALAQGIRRGQKFDITTIADDVEDMQIAYGVDNLPNPGTLQPPLKGDGSVTRQAATTVRDSDLNTSTQLDGDEWQPNVAGEAVYATADFQSDSGAPPFVHPGLPASVHCPRLHGVMVSLVARSKDPDMTYRGPTAFGLVTMNAPAPAPTTTRYRRRVQTLRINLRNFTAEQ